MKPDFSNLWEYKEKEFRFDMFLSDNFSNLEDIEQVYACVVSKDMTKLLLVNNKMGLWLLPGGKIEQDESLLDTLVREVKEETNRDIDMESVRPFFYQKSFRKNDNGEWEYVRVEVRYACIVKNDTEFISDPDDGDITETKWVPINEIGEYLKWGNTIELIQRNLLKVLSK
jgi:8-oxo-dGTP diphosphatase